MINLIAFVTLQAGWLNDLTEYIRRQVERLWNAIVEFFRDLVLYAIEQLPDLAAHALEKLPVPEFMTEYKLGTLFANAGPTIAWFVNIFKIPECMTVVSLGIVFFITRKILTLGKW
ncbi:phage coat protein [Stenotrophomonas geniculata]